MCDWSNQLLISVAKIWEFENFIKSSYAFERRPGWQWERRQPCNRFTCDPYYRTEANVLTFKNAHNNLLWACSHNTVCWLHSALQFDIRLHCLKTCSFHLPSKKKSEMSYPTLFLPSPLNILMLTWSQCWASTITQESSYVPHGISRVVWDGHLTTWSQVNRSEKRFLQ